LTVVLYSFSSWKTSLFDPVHEFPRTALLIGDLVNFPIEEVLFYLLNHFFEPFSVFKLSKLSIHIQIPVTIVVPLYFGVFGNIYNLGIFVPYSINIISK